MIREFKDIKAETIAQHFYTNMDLKDNRSLEIMARNVNAFVVIPQNITEHRITTHAKIYHFLDNLTTLTFNKTSKPDKVGEFIKFYTDEWLFVGISLYNLWIAERINN